MIVQVGVEDEHPLVLGDGEREAAVLADRHDRLDALAVGDDLVVLTEGAGGVHQPGAVGGGDELGGDDAEGCSWPGSRRTAACRCGRPGRRPVAPDDRAARRLVRGARARTPPAALGDEVARRAVPVTVGLDDDVVDVRADHDREVGRQRPRRGRPDQREHAAELVVLALGSSRKPTVTAGSWRTW